jgi:hypothetical protein
VVALPDPSNTAAWAGGILPLRDFGTDHGQDASVEHVRTPAAAASRRAFPRRCRAGLMSNPGVRSPIASCASLRIDVYHRRAQSAECRLEFLLLALRIR